MYPVLSTINKHPTNLLKQLSDSQASGCLEVSNDTVKWLIYFNSGKLTYATHSVDPSEILDLHLRRLSHKNNSLTSAVRAKARLINESETQQNSNVSSDYTAICWLVDNQHISLTEATNLVTKITKEVMESFLLIGDFTTNFIDIQKFPTIFCSLNVSELIQYCEKQLYNWKALAPRITSPYQRLYLVGQTQLKSKLPLEQYQKLSRILIGFNFHQLSVLLNKDQLTIAQSLYPLIIDGTIIVRDPQSPFDKLPKISNVSGINKVDPVIDIEQDIDSTQLTDVDSIAIKSKIVCVDDSESMLKVIKRYLQLEDLEIFTINDSLKALREIIRIQPELILLDVGMPNLDGYKLCRLIRNHSLFKDAPIIMVTGNTGFIDRTKAKIAGATDYMTKPFSKSDLEKMVFRYLTC